MSRFNDYGEEDFPNQWALYSQARRNAVRGRKGRAILAELETALMAMPAKRLIEGSLCRDGEVCALGALARHRGIGDAAMRPLDGDDAWYVAQWASDSLGLSEALAAEIEWQNDESDLMLPRETPEQRYERVLAWVRNRLEVAT